MNVGEVLNLVVVLTGDITSPFEIHVGVDTGLGRIGVAPKDLDK